jgi:hypothetical protein
MGINAKTIPGANKVPKQFNFQDFFPLYSVPYEIF